jgi:cytochrome c oxidase cbb3-type subunit 2
MRRLLRLARAGHRHAGGIRVMKNGSFLFIGLFIALAISWAGLALGSHAQLGELRPYYDQDKGATFPQPSTGIANRGKLVYQDLGCAACHTQSVRRAGFGSDIDRKWGTRQSVARDYIYQDRVQLGLSRVGPDLANVGGRVKSEADVYQLLYRGTPNMPAYPFLFEHRPASMQPSPKAIARDGAEEIVPSARAEVLAAYLLSLNNAYDYPEAKPFVPPAEGKKEGERK